MSSEDTSGDDDGATAAEVKLLPYHEKQSKFNQLCLVHAINMMIGEECECVVNKTKLDEICDNLAAARSNTSNTWWWNPHRNPFGLGNYDANVAMIALEQLGYETQFFDSRKPISELPLHEEHDNDDDDDDSLTPTLILQGLLLNVTGSKFWPGSRHWLACKKYNDCWYWLDSQLDQPKRIDDVTTTLQNVLNENGHIIIVTKKKNKT